MRCYLNNEREVVVRFDLSDILVERRDDEYMHSLNLTVGDVETILEQYLRSMDIAYGLLSDNPIIREICRLKTLDVSNESIGS